MTATASFRVQGKTPELWWPDSGMIEKAAVYQQKDGATHVLLPLGPSGSVFVVFREKAGADSIVSCRRDGQSVCLVAPGPSLPIVIHKATYGVPGDPSRTRDIRAKVQQMADAGERDFQVARLAEGDDPAFNVKKTLVVEFSIKDRPYTVQAQDPDTIHLTDQAVKIHVTKALYGVLDDPKRTRDVCEKLQRIVDRGESTFPVTRMAEGDDPAVLVVKTLVLEYTRDGKSFSVRATDADTLDLATLEPEAERIADIHPGADGRIVLQAWQPGHYDLETASGRKIPMDVPAVPAPQTLEGSWQVTFPPKWGAPEQVTFDKLMSWSEHADPGVRFFSGTATYHKTFTVPEDTLKPDRRVDLDLGTVQVMARVTLNGQDLGLLWKPPYRVDVTRALRPGENALVVQVVNLWINRMIGDETLPEDSDRNPNGTLKSWPQWLYEGKPSPTGRYTFTTWRLWKKTDALRPSGLIGPVPRAGEPGQCGASLRACSEYLGVVFRTLSPCGRGQGEGFFSGGSGCRHRGHPR